MNKAIITVVLLTLFISVNVFSQDSMVPVEVARVPTLAEAPVVDAEGNVYISEPIRGPITRITPEGEMSVWADLKGANGHKILSDGTHLVCDRSRKAILRLDSNGRVIGEAATTLGGKPFGLRGPNDIDVDSYGGFYFTDPAVGRVGYVDSSGESHLVLEYDGGPNGIALRPDGKVLYAAESKHSAIWTFQIRSPGKLGPKNVFARLFREDGEPSGCDGIAFDDNGNLYVPQWGVGQVLVLNMQGELIRRLPAGQPNNTNVALGGPDRDQLYVTGCPGEFEGEGALYRLDLKQTDLFQ